MTIRDLIEKIDRIQRLRRKLLMEKDSLQPHAREELQFELIQLESEELAPRLSDEIL